MKERETLWEACLNKGMNRRTFLKSCVALTSLMGLSTDMVSKVVEAAETKPLPVVLWLSGHECTGCSESFIRTGAPLPSDVLLTNIALEYSHILSAGSGDDLEAHLEKMMKQHRGKYILAVEGAVATGSNGIYCMFGGKPFIKTLREAAAGAAAVIAYGSCAAYGGIQAAQPNPTSSAGIGKYISAKAVVNVPGCPPIPEVMTGVVMHLAMFGVLPPLDSDNRPKQFFGNRIHDTCYRRPFFDAGMFADRYDDAGARAGWCLYRLGCRGPETYSSCGNMRWHQGLSYPIQSGAACIGCASPKFWDESPFSERMPKYGPLGDIDMIGAGMAAASVAGVAAHGALSLLQKQKRDKEEAAEARRGVTNGKEGDK